MKTHIELLQDALDALKLVNHRGNTDDELYQVGLVITSIEEKLSESKNRESNSANELISAAKAVIEVWDAGRGVWDQINVLRAAVERTEDPPAYFMEWWETFPLKTDNVVPAVHAWEAGFTVAQQVERNRIESLIATIGTDGKNECWECCEKILEKINE